LWFEVLEYGRTPGTRFTSKSDKQNTLIYNTTHPLRHLWEPRNCDAVGNGRFVCQKEMTVSLTDQHIELVRHRQIPVLHRLFRREGIFCRGRTARKNANTASLSANPRIKVCTPAYPMISSRTKRIRPFHRDKSSRG